MWYCRVCGGMQSEEKDCACFNTENSLDKLEDIILRWFGYAPRT